MVVVEVVVEVVVVVVVVAVVVEVVAEVLVVAVSETEVFTVFSPWQYHYD